ncbi:MAG: hypothetical protein E7618_02830, partial [Ruminococcaceae bacterium]|nr:hypothetical protein [Oscillospiraceae bacterium]
MKKTLALILSLLMVVSVMAIAVSAGAGKTWTDPSAERVDMNNSTKIAYRFATQGTGGLVGIQPYTAGTAGVTFSVKAYEWKYNYETTVAQEPLTAKTGLTFDGKTAYLPITFDKVLPAGGEYLIEICDVVIPAGGWALCQYVFSANPNGAFKVYKNGVGSNNTLQWQLVFEAGGWFKGGAALSEDVGAPEPEGPTLPEQVTYVNTWGKNEVERFDGNGTAALAYRFATQGSGKLIGINPQIAGEPGKFDLLVYKWDSNYETTIAGAPVLEMKEIEFDKSGKWSDYDKNDTTNGPAILFPEGLEAGEYLFVMTNFKDTSWAICNYITDAKTDEGCSAGSFKVYKNGECMDKNLKWQLIFEKGGYFKPDVLAADAPAAPKLPAEVTYANTWGSGEERFDGNGTAALAYRFATQGSGKLIGINPQIAGEPGKFDLLVYKWDSNYVTTVAGAPVLEMKEIEFDKSGKWTDYDKNDTTNGPAILFPEGLEAGEYL